MTILPGSLDYLYYNGILDHIPYEVYEMAPIGTGASGNPYSGISNGMNTLPQQSINSPAGMQQMGSSQVLGTGQYGISNSYGTNSAGLMTYPQTQTGSQYLDSAMQGEAYKSTGFQDEFVRNSLKQDGVNKGGLFKRKKKMDETDIQLYGEGIASDKQDIKTKLNKASNSFMAMPSIKKGLIGVGVMAATLILILCKKKKP